ncbi:MAG: flagellar assembly protein FliW [Myxococcota bacterium]
MPTFETNHFGTVTIDDDQILTFPQGVPGFEDLHRWALFHLEDCNELDWLQAVDEPSVALLLADPDRLFANYDVNVEPDDLEPIELSEAARFGDSPPVVMRVVLRRDSDTDGFVANLRAPILFNLENRRGMQLLLNHPHYSAHQRLQVRSKLDQVLAGFAG